MIWHRAEVCVLGGGPAGATIARRLALLGHDVLLLERCPFPRAHVGESLAPGLWPLLESLGLRDRIEGAGFLRPQESLIRWSEGPEVLSAFPGAPGLLVDRGEFDQILLDAARDAGVRILQPAEALRPALGGQGRWHVGARHGEDHHRISAAFLIDATGGRSRSVRNRMVRRSVATLALYGYWAGLPVEGPILRVEAGPEEWYWGGPLPGGLFNAMVFVDPGRGGIRGQRMMEAFYLSCIARSSLLRRCLGGQLRGPVRACDASCRVSEEPVAERLIRVGEASFRIEPLSSQGVQAAMTSGLQGSIVVHTMLTHPERASVAMQFYRDRQNEAVSRHLLAVSRIYAEQRQYPDSEFWRRRGALASGMGHQADEAPRARDLPMDTLVELDGDARLVETPCILGDLIEMRPALFHPRLQRPLAYVNDVAVAPLIEALTPGATARTILETWSRSLRNDPARRLLTLLWSLGVLQPSS